MKSILFVLAFVFSGYVFGQTGFVKGYVISLKGDTEIVEVKVNPKKTLEQYQKLTYKTANGLQKMVKPEKVKGYGFDNNHFIVDKYEGEDLFYKVLSFGTISLYQLQYEYMKMNEAATQEDFFYKKAGSTHYEQLKAKKYKKQLKEIMSANPDIAQKAEALEEFTAAKLTELFEEFNAWDKNK